MIIVINSVLYSARCLFTANYTQWSRSELIGCYGVFFFKEEHGAVNLMFSSDYNGLLNLPAPSINRCRNSEFTLNLQPLCVCVHQ